ncbi:hypothetical protein EXN66_Car013076 [Channa argus]|uniref:Uncharacterized protein n=1 Tax=Channa argus TaxID=215402 RepID=A0A6G1Q5D7_CHAAH|nr:hypothetical protein EXN66_Car013076 [Channa argus]
MFISLVCTLYFPIPISTFVSLMIIPFLLILTTPPLQTRSTFTSKHTLYKGDTCFVFLLHLTLLF